MSHFAKVESGIVTQVIVAEQSFVDSQPGTWVQTSYNTFGGVHSNGGIPLRKNYAGIGYTYDSERDAFIPPHPFKSWLLDESTCQWNPPVPMPDDAEMGVKDYAWDEATKNWIEAA